MAMPPPPPAPPMSHSRLEEGLRPGGPPPDEPVSGFIVFMNVTNTVTHLLLGAITFCAFICINMAAHITSEVGQKLSAHVYLTVIGYVLLLSQAVLSLNPQAGWADNFKYPQKSKLYWSLQVLGSLLAVIGGIVGIFAVRESSNRPNLPSPLPGVILSPSGHLQSAHQIIGLVAMVLTIVSLVGGLVNLICSSKVNISILKAIYSWLATLTLIIAFIAICLAFDEFRGLIYVTNANMAISFTVLALVGMLTMIIGNMTIGGRILF